MASPFQIEEGWLVFDLVDKAAAGYDDAWQAPGGATVDTVTLADYDTSPGSASWKCQVTKGELTASANENTVSVPATFCEPATDVPQPGATSFALDTEFLQDPNVEHGLTAYLFEFDTLEAYFALGLVAEGSPPTAIGRCRLLAGNFGGTARDNLVTTLTLPLVRKPDLWVGSTPPGRVILGQSASTTPPPIVATGATAGSPGSFTPAGSTPPADLAALSSVTASPTTAWTTGQHVITADTQHNTWNGTVWAAGDAAAARSSS